MQCCYISVQLQLDHQAKAPGSTNKQANAAPRKTKHTHKTNYAESIWVHAHSVQEERPCGRQLAPTASLTLRFGSIGVKGESGKARGPCCVLGSMQKTAVQYKMAHQLSPAASEQLIHAAQLTDFAHHRRHLCAKLVLNLLHLD